MRFATDVGGTFTDLVVEDDEKVWHMYKAPTVPDDPIRGLLDVLELAARGRNCSLSQLLAGGDMFLHGTTHPLNALITGKTARTALLTTEGHPDILLLREGGRSAPFDHTQSYPKPYIPRSLTYEIRERVMSDGAILIAIDDDSVIQTIQELRRQRVEAVAVCFLWSVANAAHELRVAELLEQHVPGVPYTLSHRLNPVMREYRRASAAAIDASLKPLMTGYLRRLSTQLRTSGFQGQILLLSSQGGVLDIDRVANAPIHLLNSGPSMAPVAGRFYALNESGVSDVIVTDAGGTTYDVSLVRNGRIPLTRETWIGRPFIGHMTGFPSVDVKSVGAGGGSVAWVDNGGAVHLGPASMGARPGPACYGLGGLEPTLTDAAVVLGYLDPNNFLGGRIKLEAAASVHAIESKIAAKLGLDIYASAWAILSVATENMAQAILGITVNQGIDPSRAVLLGGGGAAGLNSTFVARRLGCPKLVIPEAGAALSAIGALIADLRSEYRRWKVLSTAAFDRRVANDTLASLREQCDAFLACVEGDSACTWIEFGVEARYHNQAWEIHLPLRSDKFVSESDVVQFIADFHETHEQTFGVRDETSPIEIVNWSAAACCRLQHAACAPIRHSDHGLEKSRASQAYFPGEGRITTPVYRLEDLAPDVGFQGPAIVETAFATIVLDPETRFWRTPSWSLFIEPGGLVQ